VFEGGVGDNGGDGVSRFVGVGDGDEVCEGVHGEDWDWEWEAKGDGGQLQGGEAIERKREREKKILIKKRVNR
jgi:hypothetical protein